MNKTLKPENFVYWLQGFFEVSGANLLTEEQTKIVKEHLELCFEKVLEPNSDTSHSTSTVTSPLWTTTLTQTSESPIVTIC